MDINTELSCRTHWLDVLYPLDKSTYYLFTNYWQWRSL